MFETEKTPAHEVVLHAMLEKGTEVIKTMTEFGEIKAGERAALTAFIGKALGALEAPEQAIEVSKGLDYAGINVDLIESDEAIARRRNYHLEDTVMKSLAGWRPASREVMKSLDANGTLNAYVTHFMDVWGYDADEALELATETLKQFTARATAKKVRV